MVKIAIVGYNPKKIGGIESFTRTLKNMLNADVDVIYEYDQSGIFEVPDCIASMKYTTINRLVNKLTFNFYAETRIKRILYSKDYDVVILNTPRYLGVVPDLNKVILVQHTTVSNWWVSKFKFNKSENLLHRAKKVNRLIALSTFEADSIVKKFDYPKDKINHINMVTSMDIKEETKLVNKNILMLTRFQNDIKRVDLVIKAMRLLPSFKLNIYGEGVDKKLLEDISIGLDNVNIYPATTQKKSILDENSFYVISSDLEGFPISLLEASARGLPLIVRNTFLSAPCFIKGNGVLMNECWRDEDFKLAIEDCYDNFDEYSKRSVEFSRLYTVEYVSEYWNDLIQQVLDYSYE